MNPSGGAYWIPVSDFPRVVEAARRDPNTLNCFRFEPAVPTGAQTLLTHRS